jgi:single-stranded DNA-binding protein
MTAFVLVAGSLFRAPEQRTSKAGKRFVSATVKTRDGESTTFWKIVAFSETAQADLLRLDDGENLSVQGGLKVEIYTPAAGDAKASLTIFADNVSALRQPRKPSTKSKSSTPSRNSSAPPTAPDRPPPWTDDIPF